MQSRARNDLARMFTEEVGKAGLEHGSVDVHSTPRRLVLIARDVAAETQAAREEIKGPKSSAPPQALDGFLRKTGLAREELEERDGVLFAVIDRPGQPAAAVIGDALTRIVADFPWPKSMRWGESDTRWVRPLHGIVALLGEEIVPFEIGGVASGATTVGHRFHHPGAITIGGAGDYAEKLRACHVIVDQDERERIIRDGAEKAAADARTERETDVGVRVRVETVRDRRLDRDTELRALSDLETEPRRDDDVMCVGPPTISVAEAERLVHDVVMLITGVGTNKATEHARARPRLETDARLLVGAAAAHTVHELAVDEEGRRAEAKAALDHHAELDVALHADLTADRYVGLVGHCIDGLGRVIRLGRRIGPEEHDCNTKKSSLHRDHHA
jgi:hypothetical protein